MKICRNLSQKVRRTLFAKEQFNEYQSKIAGKDLIKSEKYLGSIEVFAEALEIKPSNKLTTLDLLYNRAFANSKVGNFRDSIDDCTRALSFDPDQPETRLLRAECYFYWDDFEECIRDYEIALSSDEIRENPEETTSVNAKLETARIELRRKSAEAKYTIATDQFKSKNYREAEKLYSEAIDMWHDNIIYYRDRCTCRIEMGDHNRALEDIRYIISLDGTDAFGYVRLIRCCLVLGYYDEAEKARKKLQKLSGIGKNECIDLCTKLYEYEQLAAQSYTNKQFSNASV